MINVADTVGSTSLSPKDTALGKIVQGNGQKALHAWRSNQEIGVCPYICPSVCLTVCQTRGL